MNTAAVIGLGCVSLPLGVEFGQQMRTIGVGIARHEVDASLANWRINDGTGKFISEQMIEHVIASGSCIKGGAFVDVKAAFDQAAMLQTGCAFGDCDGHGRLRDRVISFGFKDRRPLVLHLVYRFDTGALVTAPKKLRTTTS